MRNIYVGLLLVTLIPAAHAENWATADGDAEYRATQAICRKAQAVKLPQPDPAAKVAKDCDAEALYDGAGQKADPVAARACALKQWAAGGHDQALDSAGVLAMIYANGKGAPRDLDIAIAYACELDGAPAEMDGRIKHLAALKAKGPGKAPFDVCDDATSGAMEGYCAERESAVATAARNAKLTLLSRDLDPARKADFAKLQKAEAAFVAALTDNEVDVSGTARGALIVGARESHEAAFVATLEAALADKLPSASAERLATADTALNAAYAKVMAVKDVSVFGTVEKKGIKATQRTWIVYRDAFAAFVRGSATTPDTVKAALTEQRTKDLAAFLP